MTRIVRGKSTVTQSLSDWEKTSWKDFVTRGKAGGQVSSGQALQHPTSMPRTVGAMGAHQGGEARACRNEDSPQGSDRREGNRGERTRSLLQTPGRTDFCSSCSFVLP